MLTTRSERREPVVDLDREVQRILAALVPHLVDLFLDRAEACRQPVAGALSGASVDFARRSFDLLLDVADLDDGVVRFADLVADLDREIELLLQVGVGRCRAADACVTTQRLRLRCGRRPSAAPDSCRAAPPDRWSLAPHSIMPGNVVAPG